jgi:ribosomal-protein-alanine N-acetyltransferase
MQFKTKRLVIRKLKKSDIDGFYDMQSNPNVMKHIKKNMNRNESELELQRFINYYTDRDVFFNIWAVEKTDTNDFIGICGVYENAKSEFEIAYRLREKYWKKGFGIEIAKGLINHCFEKERLSEIYAYVRVENSGSINILEKEMKFVTEFYCENAKSYERIYHLKKENWLQQCITEY